MSHDLTAFEALMDANKVVLPNIWQAVFEETEEQLQAACPQGVDLLDVCRAAFDSLPDEKARDAAMDALFYGWWEALQDRKARNAWGGGAA
jgi:predicted nucleotide-binding protein (sugar kinase/HSP70/actin superfamily)